MLNYQATKEILPNNLNNK